MYIRVRPCTSVFDRVASCCIVMIRDGNSFPGPTRMNTDEHGRTRQSHGSARSLHGGNTVQHGSTRITTDHHGSKIPPRIYTDLHGHFKLFKMTVLASRMVLDVHGLPRLSTDQHGLSRRLHGSEHGSSWIAIRVEPGLILDWGFKLLVKIKP